MNVRNRQIRVAVTGGQGVGKTTFVARLADAARRRGIDAYALPSISAVIDTRKHQLGRQADEAGVLAVCDAHMQRSLDKYPGDVLICDRCAVDMMAYIELLRVTPDSYFEHFRQLTRVLMLEVDLVCYLSMPAWARTRSAPHEDQNFRVMISDRVHDIIVQLGLPYVTLADNSQAEAELALDLLKDVVS